MPEASAIARVKVDGFEIPREQWAKTFPRHGALIEILHGVRGGGGGGKNPVAAVLKLVVVVVAAGSHGGRVVWAVGLLALHMARYP